MNDDLLDILVDPNDGTPLRLQRPQRNRFDDNELVSDSGHRFPVIAGVPRFTPSVNYSESFGFQWTRFGQLQHDSSSGLGRSARRLDEETGWTPSQYDGATIVDAGCGTGRFAEVAAERGARVIAVDLSSSVDIASSNLADLPNAHVIQADIRHLPLRPDLVTHLYSIGVLQHTPEPIKTAHDLVAFVKSGASFAFTAYGRRPWTKMSGKYMLRPLTRRLRPSTLLQIVETAMPVVFPVSDRLFRLPRTGRFWRFGIPIANHVGPPGLEAPRDYRFAEAILDTFDALSPRYDDPLRMNELVSALRPLANITVVSEIPVVIRGIRR